MNDDPLERLRPLKPPLDIHALRDNKGWWCTVIRSPQPEISLHTLRMTLRRVLEFNYAQWKSDTENGLEECPFFCLIYRCVELKSHALYMSYYEPLKRDPPSTDFIRFIDIEGIEIIGSPEEGVFLNFLNRITVPLKRKWEVGDE